MSDERMNKFPALVNLLEGEGIRIAGVILLEGKQITGVILLEGIRIAGVNLL